MHVPFSKMRCHYVDGLWHGVSCHRCVAMVINLSAPQSQKEKQYKYPPFGPSMKILSSGVHCRRVKRQETYPRTTKEIQQRHGGDPRRA